MKSLLIAFSLLALSLVPAAAADPSKQVIAILSVKPPATREQIMKIMDQEIRDTVELYLKGKITQWYSRQDGRGVVFFLSCETVAEAKALTDEPPLIKANYAEFNFIGVAPLTPPRLLLKAPAPAN